MKTVYTIYFPLLISKCRCIHGVFNCTRQECLPMLLRKQAY